MTTKQKELRKQRIKNILLKTLHIVCYILSALFIVILIIAGVKSCENKTQPVNAINETTLKYKVKKASLNNNDYYVYRFKYQSGDSITIDRNEQSKFFNSDNFETVYAESQGSTWFNTYLNDDVYITNGSYFYNVVYFTVVFDSLSNDAPIEYINYKWVATDFAVVNNENSYNSLCIRNFPNYDDPDTYRVPSTYVYLYLSDDAIDNEFVNFFFEPVYESQSLIFNKQWNYNAFLGTNLNGLYGSASFDSDGENMRYKLYNTGYFVSNGQVFNQIQIWAIQSAGNTVYSVSQSTSGGLMPAPQGYWIYSFVYYRNTVTNYEVLVNYHDTIPYSTSSGSSSRYYANSSTWVNDSFRYITFLEPLSDSLRIELNAFNNNNQNYYSGQIYNDGYDVFTLLSFAFTSLSDFWSISILPGISIGVLFFLPAVVGVVIIIVHILRK